MIRLLILAIISTFLYSCGVNKNINSDFSLLPKNATELINRVNNQNTHNDWLSLKGKVHVEQKDKNITFNLNIINRNDSIIWISASGPFSIELIRIQLTIDSISVLNRINKTYFIKPISYLKEFLSFELSFYDLQDIFSANQKIPKKKYHLKAYESGFYLIEDNLSYYISSEYRIKNTKLIGNSNSIEFIFEDYHKTDSFPRKISIIVEGEENLQAAINYSDIKFSKSRKIFFEIPESYLEIK